MSDEGRGGRLSFEEVAAYLETLPGNRIVVYFRADKVPGASVQIAGVVNRVERLRIGRASDQDRFRSFCQIGEDPESGFSVSPESFEDAMVARLDPETEGLFIVCTNGYQIVIDDPRIEWGDGFYVVPGL